MLCHLWPVEADVPFVRLGHFWSFACSRNTDPCAYCTCTYSSYTGVTYTQHELKTWGQTWCSVFPGHSLLSTCHCCSPDLEVNQCLTSLSVYCVLFLLTGGWRQQFAVPQWALLVLPWLGCTTMYSWIFYKLWSVWINVTCFYLRWLPLNVSNFILLGHSSHVSITQPLF